MEPDPALHLLQAPGERGGGPSQHLLLSFPAIASSTQRQRRYPRSVRGSPGALGDYAAHGGNSSAVWDDPRNGDGVLLYADTNFGPNNTVASWRSLTAFQSVTDGLSNTLLIGEKHVLNTQFGQQAA